MNKKYELVLDSAIEVFGKKLFQIRALASFGIVSEGDLGGYIEKEDNLSDCGDAWVFGNAQVFGDAQVSGNAQVFGDAQVSGNAQVFGDAQVSGNARVYGDAQVYGNARVSGDAWDKSPAYINATKFSITMCKKGYLQIGCQCHSIKKWLSHGEKIGKRYGFSDEEIAEYRVWVEAIAKIYPDALDAPEDE